MKNWIAVVDNTLHFSWNFYKGNHQVTKLTLDVLTTDYGVFFPLCQEGFNFFSWVEDRTALHTSRYDAIAAGILVNSFAEVYYVTQSPLGQFYFQRILYGQDLSYVTSNDWQLEEALNTIISYTHVPDEIIIAYERAVVSNTGFRKYSNIKDFASLINSRRPSKRMSSFYGAPC